MKIGDLVVTKNQACLYETLRDFSSISYQLSDSARWVERLTYALIVDVQPFKIDSGMPTNSGWGEQFKLGIGLAYKIFTLDAPMATGWINENVIRLASQAYENDED